MPVISLIGTLLVILILSWAVWFVIGLARYIIAHQGEIDQRLQNFCR